MGLRKLGAILVVAVVAGLFFVQPAGENQVDTVTTNETTSPQSQPPATSPEPTIAEQAPDIVTYVTAGSLTAEATYDVYGPATGDELPIVILMPDFASRDAVQPLAEALAVSAVVIVPTYAEPARNGRFPEPLTAVACALVLAAEPSAFGGDPNRVTIVGHGFGALAGYVVANTGSLYVPSSCDTGELATAISVVGVGGTWDPLALQASAPDAMTAFMGGSLDAAPSTWELINPMTITPTVLSMTLVTGTGGTTITDRFDEYVSGLGVTTSRLHIDDQTSRAALGTHVPELVDMISP